MENSTDTEAERRHREIIKAFSFVSLFLILIVLLLAAIVFGIAEITVVPET